MEVVTDNETYCIDLLKNQITDSSNKVLFQDDKIKIIDTYKLQMKYFLDFLNNDVSELNSIENSYKILNICLSDETKR
jgi:hypothetical protein